MKRRFLAFVGALSTTASLGCTADNENYCGEGDLCNASAVRSFCDIDGVTATAERTNACVPRPSNDACNRIEICQSADKPHCTSNSLGSCVECISNSDCDSGVCGVEDRNVCSEEGDVVYVGGPGATTAATCGTKEQPCLTIASGLDRSLEKTGTLLVAAGLYSETIIASEGNQFSLFADGEVTVNPVVGDGQAAVTVAANSSLLLDGFSVSPNMAVPGTRGVQCTGVDANLALRNARVVNADDMGVFVEQGCTASIVNTSIEDCSGHGLELLQATVDIQRSRVANNDGGGIAVVASEITMTNSVVVNNGTTTSQTGGMTVTNAAGLEAVLSFNTFASNVRSGTVAHALDCRNGEAKVDNSIFMNPPDVVGVSAIDDCNHRYCLFDADTPSVTAEEGTIIADALFLDATGGDFHLAPGSPGIDAADPEATLPIDVDGDERPLGARRDIGADEAQ